MRFVLSLKEIHILVLRTLPNTSIQVNLFRFRSSQLNQSPHHPRSPNVLPSTLLFNLVHHNDDMIRSKSTSKIN